MAHYSLCMLMPIAGKDPDTLPDLVDKILRYFDVNEKQNPVKLPVLREEIERMAKAFSIDPDVLHALALKMPDWNDDEGIVENRALYCITTRNLGGKMDSWSILDYADIGDLLAEKDYTTYSVLTPAGEWFDAPPRAYTEATESPEWKQKFQSLLRENQEDCIAVLIDYHL